MFVCFVRGREKNVCPGFFFFVGVSENADGMINYSRLIEAGSSSDMLPFLFNLTVTQCLRNG